MAIHPARQAVNTLTSSSSPGEVSHAWSAILASVFPLAQGYITSPKFPFGSGDYGLYTTHYVTHQSGASETVGFFIVEIKGSDGESQKPTWTLARGQLNDYLSGMAPEDGRAVYGVIAVGRWVKFYRYSREISGQPPGTVPLHTFNHNNEAYHIRRQCATIQANLDFIRDHHL